MSVESVVSTEPSAELLASLAAHETLSAVPAEEREWFARHGERRQYNVGDIVVQRSDEVTEMMVLLTGRLVVYFDQGSGRRHLMESKAGTISGLLPYSRLSKPMGEVVIEEPADVIIIHRRHFPEMIRECPVTTAGLVHSMLDRARRFSAINWQDEKVMSLGRLAAGLAHELNNPASAAVRGAKLMRAALTEVGEAAYALGRASLSEPEHTQLMELVDRSLIPQVTGVFSPLDRADREDEIGDWLDAHHADRGPAAGLAESGVTADTLDALSEAVSPSSLDPALRWMAAVQSAMSLTTDVQRASSRIYDLVSSVKRFTYMDRAAVSAPIDITQGLMDTVTVLAAKARAKDAVVRLDIDGQLPIVQAMPAELNQVWANLLENAIDAVGASGGEVVVHASCIPGSIVVQFIDNGPGIDPEVQSKIFDPFFTTKAIGEGTGLGLDIVRRVVRGHEGQIDVESQPGRTEFRVRLPVVRPS